MRGEKLLTLSQSVVWLREELGLARDRQTVYAWLYYGRRGVKLEACSVAGQWHTSAGALRRFVAACTRQHSEEAGAQVSELQL